MPNADISRYLNQPVKHYSGSRFQQGRPILDSDFNDGYEAAGNYWREALLDITGPSGTPDDGFYPALKVGDIVSRKLVQFGAFTQAFVLDYPIKAGVMYAGGMLWLQDASESILFQREFLQMGAATAPLAAVGVQRQLSYLRGWEQVVTAVEDGEILEPAMAGADGAARWRRIRRVEVRNVQATDCAAGFAEVLDDLGNGDTGTYNAATSELQSNARLQMTFKGSPDVECGPCSPSLEGRYLGAENHAIRIMLASPDRYVWAFDNAAPIYRVKVVLDGAGGARVDLLTPPKDSYHFPRQNMIVEFLPWEALLDNGNPQVKKASGTQIKNERIAAPVGIFGEADAPYDPAARSFHVRLAAGSAFLTGVGKGKTESLALTKLKSGQLPTQDGVILRWDSQHPLAAQLNPTDSTSQGFVTYLFMRMWHMKAPDAELTVPTSSSAALGQTGLVPVFTGRGRAGDYWTITVRPDAPEEILPREIMRAGGIAPHGPRHIVAPISLVTWNSANGISHQVTAIEDCRPTLDALTERACCSFEVGPGGDFATIQAALDALPVNGGRICVRPGIYQEELRIAGRRGVVLTGCAGRTTIQSPGALSSEALLTLDLGDNDRAITISNLDFDVRGQVGIRATGGRSVELRRLRLTQNRNPDIQPHSLIETLGTRDVRIMNCRVEMDGGVSQRAAVYIDCPAGALVEGCTIETRTNQPNGLSFAWGGLHIAGGSHDVEIRDNTIRGGRGPGITLGSLAFRALNGARLGPQGAGSGLSDPQPPFSIHGVLQPIVVSDVPYFGEPQPAIDDLVIADNLIERAGGSGISSLALEVPFDDRTNGPPLCYRRRTFPIAHAVIEDNRIIDNARQPASGTGDLFAAGGIVLSEARDVTIRGNLITGNGAGMVAPVCGICVSRGQQVSVSSNSVLGNGALPDRVTPTEPIAGTSGFGPRYRGGIVLGAPFFGGRTPDRLAREGATNVHVYQNVVEQPDAAALFAVVIGAFRVNNNFLTSFNRRGILPVPTVLAFSHGRAWEGVDLPMGEPNPNRWLQPAGSPQYLNGPAQTLPAGDGGTMSFNGNQVTTVGTSLLQFNAFGVVLISMDHVSAVGNQFAARSRSRERSRLPHAMIIGVTTDASDNRVAENLEATNVSLGVMAPMLSACGSNHLTHCQAVSGCQNTNNADYFIDEDNLVWFRPPNGRCLESTRELLAMLERLCGTLFGPIRGVITNDNLIIVRDT